jgi:AraC-like DNA-binding protein
MSTTVSAAFIKPRTVAVQFFLPLLHAVQRTTGSTAALLLSAGLSEEDVQDSERLLPFDSLVKAWQSAISLCNDPLLPIRLGERSHPADFGILGTLAQSASTLGEALELGVRYERLVNQSFGSSLFPLDGHLCNRLEMPPIPVELLRPVVEFDFSAQVSFGHFLMRSAQQTTLGAVRVHFRHQAAGPVRFYEDYFACPVVFGADHNEIILPQEVLSMRLSSADPALLIRLREYVEERLARDTRPVSPLVQKIEKLVMPRLPYGLPELKDISAQLGVSVSTLKRRLSEQSTHYQGVCDSLRHRLALQYVSEPERSMVDVAFMLGFSELSTFYRAFKRWTGITPQQYRRQVTPAF